MLVADRQISYSNITDGETTKIVKRKKDGALCGTTGVTTLGAQFKRWFLAGGKGDYPHSLKITENPDDQATAFIIYPDGKVIDYTPSGWYEKTIDGFFAEGSGFELALGAMAAGKNAKEAVLIAAGFDKNTGGSIDVLELGK